MHCDDEMDRHDLFCLSGFRITAIMVNMYTIKMDRKMLRQGGPLGYLGGTDSGRIKGGTSSKQM